GWTNVVAGRAADKQADKVRDSWARETDGGGGGPVSFDSKDGIGFLHVPAMSDDEILVEQGTSMKVLNDGVAGYYTDPVKATLPTAGKKGNFSLAAPRDGHGAKIHGIPRTGQGHASVVQTKHALSAHKPAPVPKESGAKKAGHYITLTTCTPVYTSKYRYVVWGELVRTEKVDEQRTPPEELR